MTEEQKWLEFYSGTIKNLSELGIKVVIKLAENEKYSIFKTLGGVLYILNFFEVLDSISINIKHGITSTATNGLNRICTEYFFGAFYLLKIPSEYERKSLAIAFLSYPSDKTRWGIVRDFIWGGTPPSLMGATDKGLFVYGSGFFRTHL